MDAGETESVVEPGHDDGFRDHLDAILIGGRERRDIAVEPYDPAWPARFQLERQHISDALEEEMVAVHHIGSTAVPGLAAKPIIDILLEVHRPADEVAYVPHLEAVGFELRVREPTHRMLRTTAKDVHLHCWSEPADVYRHLVFRDWLRHDADDRARYGELKQRLAEQEWEDMNFYARAKSALVAEILGRAVRWDDDGRPSDPVPPGAR